MTFTAAFKNLSLAFTTSVLVLLAGCNSESAEQSSSVSSAPATGSSSSSSVTSSSSASSSSTSSVANRAPVISGLPMTTATTGQLYSFQPTATDADGDTLTFSATGLPTWATFNTSTRVLSGTPTAPSSYGPIVISVSDGKTSTSLPGFLIQVSAASANNQAPVISGAPATTITAGSNYAFTPTASDANGDTLTFAIVNRPTWASFNTATGALTGTPAASNRGTFSGIIVSVTDGKGGSASLAAFSITVANRPPTLTGAPTTSVAAGSAYTYAPVGADADGDALTWSIANMPSWASFNTTTGRLTGTPGSTAKGSYAGIVISASDGRGGVASTAAFTVTVANTAPTITGAPTLSVATGASYSFTPTASDSNGDTLAFSISNKPSWATFNTATGALTGTATAGAYANIVISVSDGTASAALAAFTLNVSSSTGNAVLTWTKPTLNTDGSTLTDLTGYKIYYGTSTGAMTSSVSVSGADTLTTTIPSLTSGTTYYFAIASISAASGEGNQSNPASKTI